MKKKGFTLIELLVVIAIIALLMGILMPALVRVRQLAIRMLCGTQLKGVGNAIMVYSGDNDDVYPIAGARLAMWGTSSDPLGTGTLPHSLPTISESFYLLVKDGYTTPKQFVCGGDWAVELKFSDYSIINSNQPIKEWAVAYDFMYPTATYCSYSYHMPYYVTINAPGFPMNSLCDPQSPLCGDRNPYLDEKATYVDDTPQPALSGGGGEYQDRDGVSNSSSHQREGQNVLFNDFHVLFEDHPNCGIDNDNIWVGQGTAPSSLYFQLPVTPYGIRPKPSSTGATTGPPKSIKDAVLVNDSAAPPKSDVRLKTNIKPLTNVLERIKMIRGVTFEWNDAAESIGISNDRKQIGVIAQDVEAVFPELVSTHQDDYKGVHYDKLTAVLIEAVKELKAENEALKLRIEALEEKANTAK